jgi:hypothetical protein
LVLQRHGHDMDCPRDCGQCSACGPVICASKSKYFCPYFERRRFHCGEGL